MVAFIKLVLSLCLLQAGPQDMPASRGYLILSAAVYTAVVTLAFSLTEWRLPPVLVAAQAALFVAFGTMLILGMAGNGARTPQTLTALYSSSAVMSAIPLLLGAVSKELSVPIAIARVVFLILLFWSFAIDSHIFSRALNTNMWMGLLVAILFFIMNQLLLSPWQVVV